MLSKYLVLLALGIGLAALSVGTADEKPSNKGKDAAAPGFQGSALLLNVPHISYDISPDHQAGTILFDDLVAAVGGTRGGTNVTTTSQTVSCPHQGNDKPVRIQTIIRGFASSTEQGRVALVLHAGGKTTVVDLVKSKTKDPAGQDAKDKGDKKNRKDALGAGFNYECVSEVTVPANAIYQVTIHLLAERQVKQDTEGGLVIVDSLSFGIAK